MDQKTREQLLDELLAGKIQDKKYQVIVNLLIDYLTRRNK